MKKYLRNKESSFAIIDNRPMFRTGFKKSILSIAPQMEFEEYGSFDELFRQNKKHEHINFFIRVGNCPYTTVVKNIRLLKSSYHLCKIVLYDYDVSINYIIGFLGEKINAYLAEDFDESEIRECLMSIASNKLYLNNQISWDLLKINPLKSNKNGKRLTATETRVADLLVRGMRTTVIAKEMDRKISTISTIKSNIYKKTNVNNIIDLRAVMDNEAVGFNI